MSSRPLLIFGAGGHAREAAWLAEACSPATGLRFEAFVVTDDNPVRELAGRTVLRLPEVRSRFPDAAYIVAIANERHRRATAALADEAGLAAVPLVHPSAQVGPRSAVGDGALIFAGAIVSADVHVGRHAHLNYSCSVSHDCVVDDFATLSPGARVAGNVHVGSGALLGIGASVVQGKPGAPLRIGRDAVVGAGAVVTREVAPGAVVAGVPARRLRMRDAE